MPDYKKMYLKMVQASEQAANILIAAQQECEELYISSYEPNFEEIALMPEHDGSADD
jgi:hypothetical protein